MGTWPAPAELVVLPVGTERRDGSRRGDRHESIQIPLQQQGRSDHLLDPPEHPPLQRECRDQRARGRIEGLMPARLRKPLGFECDVRVDHGSARFGVGSPLTSRMVSRTRLSGPRAATARLSRRAPHRGMNAVAMKVRDTPVDPRRELATRRRHRGVHEHEGIDEVRVPRCRPNCQQGLPSSYP